MQLRQQRALQHSRWLPKPPPSFRQHAVRTALTPGHRHGENTVCYKYALEDLISDQILLTAELHLLSNPSLGTDLTSVLRITAKVFLSDSDKLESLI